ncbi:hypothetical protein [Mesorhizobium sp. LNJC405B00]|uniref:hypothetical protein n=1 Tax=Mesorhizobium sp. LNJC405B00 TaxID=1287281 RepID=UPI0003CF7A95|nr:hypothetical protein [Mesorhizobium sp. LNJC405B00]ESX89697.1 hypothetical protein X755_27515 [Mesorhizobium sp. LNJC405B00]
MYLYGEITYTSVNGITDQFGFIYRYSPPGNTFHLQDIPGYTYRHRDVKKHKQNNDLSALDLLRTRKSGLGRLQDRYNVYF